LAILQNPFDISTVGIVEVDTKTFQILGTSMPGSSEPLLPCSNPAIQISASDAVAPVHLMPDGPVASAAAFGGHVRLTPAAHPQLQGAI
jgi:hypothetical protein